MCADARKAPSTVSILKSNTESGLARAIGRQLLNRLVPLRNYSRTRLKHATARRAILPPRGGITIVRALRCKQRSAAHHPPPYLLQTFLEFRLR